MNKDNIRQHFLGEVPKRTDINGDELYIDWLENKLISVEKLIKDKEKRDKDNHRTDLILCSERVMSQSFNSDLQNWNVDDIVDIYLKDKENYNIKKKQ